MDPELIVIRGGMAEAGEALFGPLRDRLRAHVRFGHAPPVVPARLGEEAGRYGAAIGAWRATGIDEARLSAWNPER
jgi:glucokinase